VQWMRSRKPLLMTPITCNNSQILSSLGNTDSEINRWVYNDRSKVSDCLMMRFLALRVVLFTQNISPQCCGSPVKYALDKAY
jgi:hypothetical protein